ncbi:hypothetical protein ABZ208_37475 [Streptomyces sp. NPDC006208]|uniref:hypothetical protein n=1 Tax=Streptomyces sp. NPDC006208 TaxID=3156734 RepID=UPI00339E75A7
MPVPGYVGMSVTPEARTAFRAALAVTSGAARRQMAVSEFMIAVSILAERHTSELIEIIDQGASE